VATENPAEQTAQAPVKSAPTDNLATDPIGRLFGKFAIPMAIGMLINGLYNLVDTFFIGQYVGANGMAGVSIVFPLQLISIALAAMISNGTSAIVSRHLGAKNFDGAVVTAANAFSLMLGAGVLIPLIMLTFMTDLLTLMGVSDILMPYAKDYFGPVIGGVVLLFCSSLITDLLRAEGKMNGLFAVILVSALGNIALDALLIAVLGWGVQGAAIATLLAQSLGLAVGLSFFIRGKTHLPLPKPTLNPAAKVIGEILALGSPVLLSYLGASLIIALVNFTLANSSVGETEVLIGAYGVLGRINIFIIMPLIAMTHACQTIAAYNYGAGFTSRVDETVKTGMKVATVYLGTIAAIMLLFPRTVMSIFSDNVALINQGELIAQIMFIGLPLSGVGTMAVALFQAIGRAKWAAVISAGKIYFLLLPLVIILPKLHGTNAIWYAFPMADSVMFIFVCSLLVWYRKNR
jgi:putative MATE family efflux protein